MPLRVNCPNGCLLRLPTNRAGKMVRCPECKSVIRIPQVSATEKASGKPIPIDARLVKKGGEKAETARPFTEEPGPDTAQSADAPPAVPAFLAHWEAGPSQEFESVIQPGDTANGAGAHQRRGKPAPYSGVEKGDVANPGDVADQAAGKDAGRAILITRAVADEAKDWTGRLSAALAEKYLVNRFYALALVAAGLFDLAPVLVFWFRYHQADWHGGIPLWVWLLGWGVLLQFAYAVFVWQIRDWSALHSVAVVQLIVAVALVFAAMILILSGDGAVSEILGLGGRFVRNATLWIVARICLALILSFLLGREVYGWRRSESLLAELLAQNAAKKNAAAE